MTFQYHFSDYIKIQVNSCSFWFSLVYSRLWGFLDLLGLMNHIGVTYWCHPNLKGLNETRLIILALSQFPLLHAYVSLHLGAVRTLDLYHVELKILFIASTIVERRLIKSKNHASACNKGKSQNYKPSHPEAMQQLLTSKHFIKPFNTLRYSTKITKLWKKK